MLSLRLQRIGKKSQAQFRLILQEKTRATGSSHLELLGHYNPHTNKLVCEKERVMYWVSKGAQPTHTVHNLFVKEGFIKGDKKRSVYHKKKVETPAAPEKTTVTETPKEAAPETPRAETK